MIAYNPRFSLAIRINDIFNSNIDYKIELYDKCMESEKEFVIKYGNIIINRYYAKLRFHYNHENYVLNTNSNLNNIKKNKITWCITSLRNKYDAVIQFNETISLSLKYKVDRIILYYSDISNRIKKIIQKYEKKGIIESYYFEENADSCNMKICGKVLQLNDCFYRSLNNSMYLLNMDIDEIIIPKNHLDYIKLLKWGRLSFIYTNMYIFYTKLCIKSSIIYNEKRKNPSDYMRLPKVIDSSIYEIKNCCTISVIRKACSKYIIKYSMIEALWLHDIWKGEYNYTIIPINIAYTRHTRHLSIGLKKVCYNYSSETI